MHLQKAAITYGASEYEVKADDVWALPVEFNFNDPTRCALQVLAALSEAGGGHTLRDCRVVMHKGRHTATVSANGAYARFAPRERGTPLSAADALRIMGETETIQLGSVTCRGGQALQLVGDSYAHAQRRWRSR